jgi:putative alpha-1,2-mannosidase
MKIIWLSWFLLPALMLAQGASVALDGSPIRNWWIHWNQMSKADKLVFTLTATPNRGAGEMPPSYPPASK